jgi:hypothetical protein
MHGAGGLARGFPLSAYCCITHQLLYPPKQGACYQQQGLEGNIPKYTGRVTYIVYVDMRDYLP